MKRIIIIIMIAGLLLSGCGKKTEVENKTVTIAAAASLKNVFEKEIIPAFKEVYPDIEVVGVYDSSGKLQIQIEEGLEADIFFSAAQKQMDALDNENYIVTSSRVNLLQNNIVLIVPSTGNCAMESFEDIVKADYIAIGDPEIVPAGQYAKEALESLGLWADIVPRVSFGTNVTEVLNQVAEGSAEAGIVYKTDAISMADKVTIIASAPEGTLKNPVTYPVALIEKENENEAAKLFFDFLISEECTSAYEGYGYTATK